MHDLCSAPVLGNQEKDDESDDERKLADVAKAAGVDVTLSIYPERPHIWTMSYPAFPEAVEGVTEMAEFVARVTA